jgi:hypothetical protein
MKTSAPFALGHGDQFLKALSAESTQAIDSIATNVARSRPAKVVTQEQGKSYRRLWFEENFIGVLAMEGTINAVAGTCIASCRLTRLSKY